jgi:hypothetical protein
MRLAGLVVAAGEMRRAVMDGRNGHNYDHNYDQFHMQAEIDQPIRLVMKTRSKPSSVRRSVSA